MKFKCIFALFLCILLCGCAYASDNTTLDDTGLSEGLSDDIQTGDLLSQDNEDCLGGDVELVIPDITYNWGESGSVSVESDAEGILLNDSSYADFVTIKDKTITVTGLAAGEYYISFVTSDPVLDNVYRNAHVTVLPVQSTLNHIDDFSFDWSTGSISVDYSGAFNVTAEVINHTEAVVNISNKLITISGLNVGEYVLNVTTRPDENHTSVSQCVNFKINRINCNVNMTVDSVKYNQRPVVVIDLPDTTTGVFNVVFNNAFYTINLTDKARSVELPLLPVGEYNLFGFWEGDVNYYPVYLSSQFFNISYYTADDLKYKIDNNLDIMEDYVFKADDKPVNINSSVKVNFNGHIIDANNAGGVFNIIADNVELSNFTVINSNGKIIDSKANNTVLKDISFTNNNGSINIDGDGAVLSNVDLISNSGIGIVLNGNAIKADKVNVLNHKGVLLVINGDNTSLSDSGFTDGIGEVIAVNGANTGISDCSFINNTALNSSVIVIKANNTNITDSVFKDNNVLNVISLDKGLNASVDDFSREHGGVLAEITQINNVTVGVDGFDAVISLNLTALNGTVFTVVNGQLYNAGVLNGTCQLKLVYLPVGDYNITVYYNGTLKYSKASCDVNFTVSKQSVKINAVNSVYVVNYDRTFTVALIPALKGKTVSFTFNGRKYSAKTNKYGVAVFKLKKAVAKDYVIVGFAGDERYLPASKKVKITVGKEKPVLKVNVKKAYKLKGVKKFKVILKDSKNKALKNKWVYIKVSKKSNIKKKVKKSNSKKKPLIRAKTNSKGIAVLKVDRKFKISKYNYKVTYKGSNYYQKVVKKGTFKIV